MTAPRVVLMGPPGSGKTTVSKALGAAWSCDVVDTDAMVEAATGQTVADIFVSEGEPRFRELEREAVASALDGAARVISLGGGAALHPLTQEALRAFAAAGGHVVFLDVSLTAVVPRVGLNATRPLLLGNPRQQWLSLMNDRRPVYESLATLTVLTDAVTPAQLAEQIAEAVA